MLPFVLSSSHYMKKNSLKFCDMLKN